jgi:hypothetical protein
MCRVVYQFGIFGWYCLGILPTDTKRKLGWYILVSKNWREPFFTVKRGLIVRISSFIILEYAHEEQRAALQQD